MKAQTGVFKFPTLTWILSAILLIFAARHLVHATKAHGFVCRVNQSLHALMNLVMAAMLWNLVPRTMLAQIMVLAGAALWFLIQAVARPEFTALRAGSQSRLKSAYYSITMASAAVMVAMMGHVTEAGQGTVPNGGMAMSMTHHPMAATIQSAAARTADGASSMAISLTVFFGAAAVVFTVLLLSPRGTKTKAGKVVTRVLHVRAEHALEALGAAAMALMSAAMTT